MNLYMAVSLFAAILMAGHYFFHNDTLGIVAGIAVFGLCAMTAASYVDRRFIKLPNLCHEDSALLRTLITQLETEARTQLSRF